MSMNLLDSVRLLDTADRDVLRPWVSGTLP
jgi:hypothetical protein